jgi:tellurite resistance protein
VLAFALLVPSYLVKLWKHPGVVRQEFLNPAQLGFCGALPVGMSLVAGGIAPYSFFVGNILWWASCALLVALQVWALYRWLSGGIELAQVNAGWLLIMAGGIVFPSSGIALGNVEASRFMFGVSAAAAPILTALLFVRAALGPPLPELLRPSWFILLVPPSLVYANGLALYEGSFLLESLYFFALVLAAALLVYARGLARWPFGAPWWAFTFPLDALAYAAARYAQDHPSPGATALAGATLLLATLFVLAVLWRTLRSAAWRRA